MINNFEEERKGLGMIFGKTEGFLCEDEENVNLADLQQICEMLVAHCKIDPRRVLLAAMVGAYGIMGKTNNQIVDTLKQLIEDQKQNLKYIQFQCQGVGDTFIGKITSHMELPEEAQQWKMLNFVAKEFMKKEKEDEDKDE